MDTEKAHTDDKITEHSWGDKSKFNKTHHTCLYTDCFFKRIYFHWYKHFLGYDLQSSGKENIHNRKV